MGHDYLSFKNQHKQINDDENQILYGLVIETISRSKRKQKITDNISRLCTTWTSGNLFNGSTGTDFDDYLKNQDDVNCFITLLSESKKIVQTFGPSVPSDFLNQITSALNGPLFSKDYDSQKILNTIDAVVDLVQ